jgi:hypothetical protein
MLLALLAGGFAVSLGMLAPSVNLIILLLMAVLVLIGLHLAVSEASWTFGADAHHCTVRRSFLGLFRRERTVEFVEVVIQRRVDWNALRWMYRIILPSEDDVLRKSVRIGYMTDRARCEALAIAIARFANVVAVKHDGRILHQAGADAPEGHVDKQVQSVRHEGVEDQQGGRWGRPLK